MLHNIKYLLSGKQSVFVNVGRANVVSDEALLKALDNKWISTAILDVFHEEPVPKVCIMIIDFIQAVIIKNKLPLEFQNSM